jgi:hypothetical protein
MRYIKNYNEFLITENYSNKIIVTLLKKFGNDLENNIFIFGLFRNNKPFLGKDILSLSKEEFLDLYNSWYEKSLSDIITVDGPFKKNRKDTEIYLNAYINNIKSLKDKAKPFVISNYEKTLVDIVNNNKWLNNDSDISINNIENPLKEDIVFESNDILIVKGFTKTKCQIYGQGYSWCISQETGNYFSKYRFDDGATIYFVLNKKLGKDNNERLCVILIYPGNLFSIADATNYDDRSGGVGYAEEGFSSVEGELPWLRGMSQYFKYLPVTDTEKKYNTKIQQKITNDDFISVLKKYFNTIKKDIDISFEDVFRDYLLSNHLTINQQEVLIKDKYLLDLYFTNKLPLDISIYDKLDAKYKMKFVVNRYKNKNVMPQDYGFDMKSFDLDELKDFISRFNIKDVDTVFSTTFLKNINPEYIKYFVNLFLQKYELDLYLIMQYVEYVDISLLDDIKIISFPMFNSLLQTFSLKKVDIVAYIKRRIGEISKLIDDNITYLYCVLRYLNPDKALKMTKELVKHIKINEEVIKVLLDYNRENIDDVLDLILANTTDIDIPSILTITNFVKNDDLIKDLLNKTKDAMNDDYIINIVYNSKDKKGMIEFIDDKFKISNNALSFFKRQNYI